jgi:hypothetical protein
VYQFEEDVEALEAPLEMEFGIYEYTPLCCMFNVPHCKNPLNILVLHIRIITKLTFIGVLAPTYSRLWF